MGIDSRFKVDIENQVRGRILRSRQGLKLALQEQVTRIRRLVSKGKRFDGTALPSYKPKYRAKRAAAGYKPAPMDLTITGSMLRALDSVTKIIKGVGIQGQIGFRATKSRPPKGFGGGNVNDRQKASFLQDRFKFFGVTDKQLQQIIKTVERSIKK